MLRIVKEIESVIDEQTNEKTHIDCLVFDEMNPTEEFICTFHIKEFELVKNLNTMAKSIGIHAPTMDVLWNMIEAYADSKK